MQAVSVVLRFSAVLLFLWAVSHAVRPRGLEVALFMALAVLVLLVAEALAPRTPTH